MEAWLVAPAVVAGVVSGIVGIVVAVIGRRGAMSVATTAPYQSLVEREALLTERVNTLESRVDALSRQIRSDHSWVRQFVCGLPEEHRPPPGPPTPDWLRETLGKS
ncbi:MAG: hypothetical protein LBS56_10305 [Propionibacteriaceae bacterium]|jgi:hypothetical protein|nr:hypothetical protein [Propionibacteriaceae bacterium]